MLPMEVQSYNIQTRYPNSEMYRSHGVLRTLGGGFVAKCNMMWNVIILLHPKCLKTPRLKYGSDPYAIKFRAYYWGPSSKAPKPPLEAHSEAQNRRKPLRTGEVLCFALSSLLIRANAVKLGLNRN